MFDGLKCIVFGLIEFEYGFDVIWMDICVVFES